MFRVWSLKIFITIFEGESTIYKFFIGWIAHICDWWKDELKTKIRLEIILSEFC